MSDIDVEILEAVQALTATLDRLTTPISPLVYRTEEAAQALGVTAPVVRKMMRDGDLRYVVLPGMSEKRIPVAAVEALVAPERWATVAELEEAS